MKGDYKVPPKMAEKLIKDYAALMVVDSDTGELQYIETLDAIAEAILNDWSQAKIHKHSGQEITDPDKMSDWLRYNLPELFEMFLKMNDEL